MIKQVLNFVKMSQKSYVAGSAYPPLETGVLRIYSMRFCPFAQRTRLVLQHKNIPHENVNVHLVKKPEWFLERNPFGLVPTLEIDDKVIYESNICSQYLDDVYPGDKLTPSDPYQKARDQMLIDTFGKAVGQFYKIARNGEDFEEFKKSLGRYEEELSKRGKYFGGNNKPCMVDFALWPWFERLELLEEKGFKLTEAEFPNLSAWVKTMYQLPAVKATMFDKESHMRFLTSYREGNPDYDFGL
ncbi:glutathione S-transferase omega-1 isoform X1 [Patella vulgata]|uniref:glutathione S-transferase omega-1 isoform X1 n=2 Tax=Patella vulgata TaxID=6465 RepID=UPI00217F4D76|nr:glutathione S-transferase omega-1 isoform X1 [Patella vulgata]